MAGFVKGDVVVVPFPFSDLSNVTKLRPAYVACNLKGNDLILCQITSKVEKKVNSIKISNADFAQGSIIHSPCNLKVAKIFTADESIIIKKVGNLNNQTIEKITNNIIDIFKK